MRPMFYSWYQEMDQRRMKRGCFYPPASTQIPVWDVNAYLRILLNSMGLKYCSSVYARDRLALRRVVRCGDLGGGWQTSRCFDGGSQRNLAR